jgi:hypothetical protein
MKTLKELAQESLDVQNASNLSGVVHGFSRAITDLRAHLESEPGFSTYKLNVHPICQLWSDKIASLTNTQSFNDVTADAYMAVRKIVEG